MTYIISLNGARAEVIPAESAVLSELRERVKTVKSRRDMIIVSEGGGKRNVTASDIAGRDILGKAYAVPTIPKGNSGWTRHCMALYTAIALNKWLDFKETMQ